MKFPKAQSPLRLLHKRWLLVLLAALLGGLIPAKAVWENGAPPTSVHDEWAYLLQAETFARGRLTNPTPPMWDHFESFHVLMQPTYQAKYPPGQAIFMAIGIALTNNPMVGVWISVALACGAIMWMLLAFLPARYAILGTLLVCSHPLMLAWGTCYWGGAVACAGGALAVGAMRRIVGNRLTKPNPKFVNGIALGIGVSIISLTRPFEGFFLSVAILVVVCTWIGRTRKFKPILATLAILLVTFVWMAYYNWRVTGNALRLPYMEHDQQYSVTTPFLFGKTLGEHAYRHPIMKAFHTGWQLDYYKTQQTLGGFIQGATGKLARIAKDFRLPIALPALLIVGVAAAFRSRWSRFAIFAIVLVVLGLLSEIVFNTPYAAPIYGLLILLAASGAKQLMSLKHLARFRRPVYFGLLALTLAGFAHWNGVGGVRAIDWAVRKQSIERELQETPNPKLVFVRSIGGDLHGDEVHQGWVANGPDIKSQPIVWAWDMGRDNNRKLLLEYPNRQAFLLQYDASQVRIDEYAP